MRKAIAEAERVTVEWRKAGAQDARDLAVLASGHDTVKAVSYYRRATVLAPHDAGTWTGYARAAMDAGRPAEAKAVYAKASFTAQDANDTREHYWALLGVGEVALPEARRAYETASAVADRLAKVAPA